VRKDKREIKESVEEGERMKREEISDKEREREKERERGRERERESDRKKKRVR